MKNEFKNGIEPKATPSTDMSAIIGRDASEVKQRKDVGFPVKLIPIKRNRFIAFMGSIERMPSGYLTAMVR